MQKAYEYNYPLWAKVVTAHKGKLPRSHSFVSVMPANVILHTVKKVEPASSFSSNLSKTEDVWVLRLFEAYGQETDAVISLPGPLKRAVLSNILEEDGENLLVEGNQVRLKLAAHRIATIKVWF